MTNDDDCKQSFKISSEFNNFDIPFPVSKVTAIGPISLRKHYIINYVLKDLRYYTFYIYLL